LEFCYAILGKKLWVRANHFLSGERLLAIDFKVFFQGSHKFWREWRHPTCQPSLTLRMTKEGDGKAPGTRSFTAAQDDTSRMKRLLRLYELLEAMHTLPAYTLIIEKEEQI
jgi:hypothetical protein